MVSQIKFLLLFFGFVCFEVRPCHAALAVLELDMQRLLKGFFLGRNDLETQPLVHLSLLKLLSEICYTFKCTDITHIFKIYSWIFLKIFISLCINMWDGGGHTHSMVPMWKPEDNFVELVLYFYLSVSLGNYQVYWLCGSTWHVRVIRGRSLTWGNALMISSRRAFSQLVINGRGPSPCWGGASLHC